MVLVVASTHDLSSRFQLQLVSRLQLLLHLPAQLLLLLLLPPPPLGGVGAGVGGGVLKDKFNVCCTPHAFMAAHVSRVKCFKQHSSGVSNK
jgi:ribosomal protein S27AE